jgi:hypothetical protein
MQALPRREGRPAYFTPVPVFALAQNGDGIHSPVPQIHVPLLGTNLGNAIPQPRAGGANLGHPAGYCFFAAAAARAFAWVTTASKRGSP